jgi:hypothetical protein
MRVFYRGLASRLSLLPLLAVASPAVAQPARSGGYDITYGVGTASGDLYINQKGAMATVEVLFSTRMDGTNTPFLMGAHIGYFASEDPTGECVPSPFGCAPSYPDMAFAGLQGAYEPLITSSTFFHLSAGGSFLQPSSSGGPTIGLFGAARLGQGIGRHLGVTIGARSFFIPDLRGETSLLTTYSAGIRIR